MDSVPDWEERLIKADLELERQAIRSTSQSRDNQVVECVAVTIPEGGSSGAKTSSSSLSSPPSSSPSNYGDEEIAEDNRILVQGGERSLEEYFELVHGSSPGDEYLSDDEALQRAIELSLLDIQGREGSPAETKSVPRDGSTKSDKSGDKAYDVDNNNGHRTPEDDSTALRREQLLASLNNELSEANNRLSNSKNLLSQMEALGQALKEALGQDPEAEGEEKWLES
ncbi:hypothetical protein F4778DRAFT_780003 [Xylariomycetidae sp. FL2044]|nr:hypothetical protein F4778DRAFT_780003 [Xylariomycetidae sp. FL2044]